MRQTSSRSDTRLPRPARPPSSDTCPASRPFCRLDPKPSHPLQKLKPGSYLLRWRVKTLPVWAETLSISAALSPCDGAGATGGAADGAVPSLVLAPVPPALSAAAVEWHQGGRLPKLNLRPRQSDPAAAAQPPAAGAGGAAVGAAAEQTDDPSRLEGSWRVTRDRTDIAGHFSFLSVAVVRIAVEAEVAELHVRIWKHTGSWIQNIWVDYLEVRLPAFLLLLQITPAVL